MKISKNFNKEEFMCPCCKMVKIDTNLLDSLQKARDIAGIPFVINSAYRCKKHNEEVDGKPDSSHIKGCAVDIRCDTNNERYIILNSLILVGFNRIGIGKNFIHVDTDNLKPSKTIWLY